MHRVDLYYMTPYNVDTLQITYLESFETIKEAYEAVSETGFSSAIPYASVMHLAETVLLEDFLDYGYTKHVEIFRDSAGIGLFIIERIY